ncbi:MAG: LamG-like jellyroll fold domain-containing protein [Patescibacteria group bacterium]
MYKSLKTSIFIALVFVLFSPQAVSADITTGLVGHWKLNEGSGTVATDSGSGGNEGVLTGNPTWTTGQIGDYAVDFDGDDFIEVTDPNFGSANTFTVSLWIYPTNANTEVILNYGNDTAGRGWRLIRASNGTINFRNALAQGGSGTAVAPLNTWTHIVAFISTGWNDINTYVNGSADYSTHGGDTSSPNSTDDFRIARNWDNDQSGTSAQFIGRIDDVRYYNRLLSGNDIAELYAYTEPVTVVEAATPHTTSIHHKAGTPPVVSLIKAIDITDSSATVTWTTDLEAHGEVYYGTDINPTDVKTDWTPTKDHSIKLENLQPKTTYHYSVRSKDTITNSALTYSDRYSFTTIGVPDTEPPETPKFLRSRSLSSSNIDLLWSNSTDNNNGVRYNILRDDTLIATTINNSFRDDNLSPDTRYSYAVSAIDTSENESDKITVTEKTRRGVSASNLSFDNTPPETPRNLRAEVVSDDRIDLRWTEVDDDSILTRYNVFRDDFLIDTVVKTLYRDIELSPNTTYTYSVSAMDISSNESLKSFKAKATTFLEINYCSAFQKQTLFQKLQNFAVATVLRFDY